MRSTSSLRTIIFSVLFLVFIGAQSSRVLTMFGSNTNFFMAGLPALLMTVPRSAFVFLVIAGVVMLKTALVFEWASLALLLTALLIFLGRRFAPLHPALLNPVLSAAGVAGFYALTNRAMFSVRGALLTELFIAAVLSFTLTLFTSYDRR